MRSTLPALLVLLLALGCPAFGQYTTDFENNNPNWTWIAAPSGIAVSDPTPSTPPAGCPMLPGTQDCFYMPNATSVVYNAYTYGSNALMLPPNPTGGNQFVGGTGPAGGVFARAQREVTLGPGAWTFAFDIAVTFQGVLPTAQNAGSFSLQDTTSAPVAQYFIALATWVDTNTAANWNADFRHFDAAGVQVPAQVPNTNFQNLLINNWYRWEIDVNFTTNEVWETRLTDLSNPGVTHKYCPVGWYLAGGTTGTSALPIGFRLFGGGSVAGNVLAFDNVSILPSTTPAEFQMNQLGASLDVNGATNAPCRPIQVSFPAGAVQTLNLGGTAGGFWDIALTIPELSVPLSAGGVLVPGSGDIVNANLLAPSLTFLNPGTPFVPVALPLLVSAGPFDLTGQLVVADATNPAGFLLSAAMEISVP